MPLSTTSSPLWNRFPRTFRGWVFYLLAIGLTTSAAFACWRHLTMPVPDEQLLVTVGEPGHEATIAVDVFLPTTTGTATRHPSVVLLHGVEGADLQARAHFQTARRLNRQGYTVFFVHYFEGMPYDDLLVVNDDGELDVNAVGLACLRDSQVWTDCVTNVIAAIAERNDVDDSRLAIEGFSLGGYVALATAARLEGDADLPDAAAVVVNWGAKFEDTEFTANYPPTFFVHGERDAIVPLADARATFRSIQECGADAELFVVTGGEHMASSVSSIEATEEFLARHLRPQLSSTHISYAASAEICQFQVHESLWEVW